VPVRLVVGLLMLAGVAHGEGLGDRFRLKISLTALYIGEQESAATAATAQSASLLSIGYGDLRVAFDATRLASGFELHLDGRVRLTGEYASNADGSQVSARGYLGGREYELRQLEVMRRGAKVDLQLGRVTVLEADGQKLDGLRVAWRFARHWEGALFGGGAPNPFSRSLTTDYAGAQVGGGLSVAYRYDRFWGWLGGSATYLPGLDDGGKLDLANPVAAGQPERVRGFVTWVGYERPTKWLDLYHNLVLDLAGAAGVQLTRLDLFATARIKERVTIRLSYGHLSSLAIEMYLTSLLAARADFSLARTVTNNLIVQRTARDQGRVNLEVHMGKLHVFGEGQVRVRGLVDSGADPQFVVAGTTDPVAPRLAWDATVGLRDSGSWRGVRGTLAYTYLADYRSQSHVLDLQLGRSFFDDRLSFDGAFLWAKTRDAGVGGSCATVDTTLPAAVLAPACFGTRDGNSYELGLTVTVNPQRHWFALLDYRLVMNQTEAHPLIVTHVLLARIEARY